MEQSVPKSSNTFWSSVLLRLWKLYRQMQEWWVLIVFTIYFDNSLFLNIGIKILIIQHTWRKLYICKIN